MAPRQDSICRTWLTVSLLLALITGAVPGDTACLLLSKLRHLVHLMHAHCVPYRLADIPEEAEHTPDTQSRTVSLWCS